MKGQAEVINALGIIVIAGVLLFLFFIILPRIIDLMWTEIGFASANVVSKELADYITISGSATDSIEIFYHPSDHKYNVELKDRIVTVSMEIKDKKYVEPVPERGKIGIDPAGKFASVNFFFITKEKIAGRSVYGVEAE